MIINVDKCIYCSNPLYTLADGRVKCSQCKRKYSKEKLSRIITLIECFINDESALSSSKRLSFSYVSVQKYYENFRILCAQICEEEYERLQGSACEYEEYHYLEHSKKLQSDAIFNAQNFLTFDYNSHIYNLLMPSLHRYKTQRDLTDSSIDLFKKFKRTSKIVKVSKNQNNIIKFWEYFERSILKYKGVTKERFAYFLKEFEFKYNHSKNQAIDLLIQQYIKARA